MAEYIEREAAVAAVKHAWSKGLEPSQYLEIIPAADVSPVRPGRWIDNGLKGYRKYYYCSECGGLDVYPLNDRYKFCPNCGARMDEVSE